MEELALLFGSVEHLSPFGFLIRVIGVSIILYIASRFLPRRSGGQYSSYDFAFFWMMGGLVASPLFDSKISFSYVLVSIITIYLLHYFISYIMVKSRTIARIIGGKAIPLVQNGIVLRHNMKTALFPLEMLLSELRQADAPNLAEVEEAVLETSGHVSVLKKSDFHPVNPQDLNIDTFETGLPLLLVNDGKTIKLNLQKLSRDESWLQEQLEKHGVLNQKNVYLAGIDGSGQFFYSASTI